MKQTIQISIILSTLLVIAQTAPTENADVKTTVGNPAEVSSTTETFKEPSVVSYVQNFKNAMTDYVISEYKDLTPDEIEQVKKILEEFLTNFADALRKSVEKQQERDRLAKAVDNKNSTEANADVTTQISQEDEEKRLDEDLEKLAELDGTSNAMFDDVKIRLKSEFPEINDLTAKEIVYYLRKHLYETRDKLDKIINDSKYRKAVKDDISTVQVTELTTTVS